MSALRSSMAASTASLYPLILLSHQHDVGFNSGAKKFNLKPIIFDAHVSQINSCHIVLNLTNMISDPDYN